MIDVNYYFNSSLLEGFKYGHSTDLSIYALTKLQLSYYDMFLELVLVIFSFTTWL